jgi:tRNA-Thr(GGU) m(6)t(6)A37 methyltransferase TsaA
MPDDKNASPPVTLRPIGVIHSPHTREKETPIQPVYAGGIKGTVEIFPKYAEGLRDIEGFSHIYLIYHFHKARPTRLIVKPFLEDVFHGVFATRTPHRPNPIGLSVVRLVKREGNLLHIEDVDVLDGTPLLDIKPYISRFDHREDVRDGWHAHIDEGTALALGNRQHDTR